MRPVWPILIGTLILASSVPAGVAETPALPGRAVIENFGLAAEELPSRVYLVEGPDHLPDSSPVLIHGSRGSLHLVSGDEHAVLELTSLGFRITPLDPLTTNPESPPRVWNRIQQPDPRIQALVDAVEWAPLQGKIRKLERFGTRSTFSESGQIVPDSLAAFFERKGLAVEFHYFGYRGVSLRNVVATQPGVVHPDSVFIIGAHYDSTSDDPLHEAPGADDNASGVAAVQTVAQLLAPHKFAYTIKYVCFGAEEQGKYGSLHYAGRLSSQGVPVLGMLNLDMIGYWSAKSGGDFDLEVTANIHSTWLLDAITNAADLYTTMPYQRHVNDAVVWGDHASFWSQGYAAVNHEEASDLSGRDFNPAYHTTNDRLLYINEEFMVGNTRIAVAALATLAGVVEANPPQRTSVSRFKGRFGGRRE